MKQIRHQFYSINIIIYINSSSNAYIIKNVTNFILDISNKINKSYNRDLKDFLAMISNNSKHILIV